MDKTDPRTVIAALEPLLAPERITRLEQVAASRLGGIEVVLEDLHDPHNGGAALRSCEGVGVLGVHVVEKNEPFRFSERVTQGCEKWLTLTRHATIDACVSELAARGVSLYAAVPGAPTLLEDLDPVAPAAFLIGNEHDGLSTRARALCHQEFSIPLHGFTQSVNLSVATALTVYTHARRRRSALGTSGDLVDLALLELRARYYFESIRGADAIVERYAREHQG